MQSQEHVTRLLVTILALPATILQTLDAHLVKPTLCCKLTEDVIALQDSPWIPRTETAHWPDVILLVIPVPTQMPMDVLVVRQTLLSQELVRTPAPATVDSLWTQTECARSATIPATHVPPLCLMDVSLASL